MYICCFQGLAEDRATADLLTEETDEAAAEDVGPQEANAIGQGQRVQEEEDDEDDEEGMFQALPPPAPARTQGLEEDEGAEAAADEGWEAQAPGRQQLWVCRLSSVMHAAHGGEWISMHQQ